MAAVLRLVAAFARLADTIADLCRSQRGLHQARAAQTAATALTASACPPVLNRRRIPGD